MQKKINYITLLRYSWDPGMDDFLGKQKLPNYKMGKPKKVSNHEKKPNRIIKQHFFPNTIGPGTFNK